MMPPHMWPHGMPPAPGYMPHGMPPPMHGMPPFGHVSPLDETIVMFCRQCAVDASAERALRMLAPHAQQRILDEGPVGGGNPSLELMSRIHRHETWEHGQHVHGFLGHGRQIVDATSEDTFRRLEMEQQRAVMSFGPLMSADPSGELMARVRDVQARGVGASAAKPGGGDEIANFCAENSIDSSAQAHLRKLPPSELKKVLDEGPVRGTKNPSAVLMSRIRKVKEGHNGRKRSGSPTRNSHAPSGGPGRGRSRSRSRKRSRSRSRHRSKSRRRSRSRSRKSRSRSRRNRRSRSRRRRSRSSSSRSRSRRRSSSKGKDPPTTTAPTSQPPGPPPAPPP